MHILMVGMGDIGRRIVPLLHAKGHHVSGMRRQPRGDEGCMMLAQDIHQPDLSSLAPIDWVYVILSPDQMTSDCYQRTYVDSVEPLTQALCGHPIQRIVFVSSTSVYGQHAGEWVDEQSPTVPTRFNGQLLRQAEQAWQRAWPDRVTVVRPSGIYSAERRRLYHMLEQGNPVAAQAWTNRIHRDDLVGFLVYLSMIEHIQPLYLATDDCPVPLDRILCALARQCQLASPSVDTTADVSGKRIGNRALTASGYHLMYTDWQQGYHIQNMN
jgi:nucleoside-diphosphate-sugar epimerase